MYNNAVDLARIDQALVQGFERACARRLRRGGS
jgi:hypothetical protein